MAMRSKTERILVKLDECKQNPKTVLKMAVSTKLHCTQIQDLRFIHIQSSDYCNWDIFQYDDMGCDNDNEFATMNMWCPKIQGYNNMNMKW